MFEKPSVTQHMMMRAMTSAANGLSLRHMDPLSATPIIGRRVIMTLPVGVITAWEIMAEAANRDRDEYVKMTNTIAAIAHQTHPELRGMPPFIRDMAEADFLKQMVDRWILPQAEAQQEDPSLLADTQLRTIMGTLCMPEDDNAHWSLCQIRCDDGLRLTLPTGFLSCRPKESVEDEQVELFHPDVSALSSEHGRLATREFVTSLMRGAIELRDPEGSVLFEVLGNVDRGIKDGIVQNGDVISVHVDANALQRKTFNLATTMSLQTKVRDVEHHRHDDFQGLLLLDELADYFPQSWRDAYANPSRNLSNYTFTVIGKTHRDEFKALREKYDSIESMPDHVLETISNDLRVRCVETGEEMGIPSGVVTDKFVLINGLTLADLARSRGLL